MNIFNGIFDRNLKDIFLSAFALISDPTKWTQGVSARSESGTYRVPTSMDAVRWCSTGAIEKAGGIASYRLYEIKMLFAPYLGEQTLSVFNDTHRHSKVVALWREVGEAQGWL